jgi:hypothetical protein
VVLDGLDHCTTKQKDQILDSICHLGASHVSGVKINFFVTSQKKSDMSPFLTHLDVPHIQLPHYHTEEDITRFVMTRAGQIPHRMLHEIIERSQRRFSWTSLQLDNLLKHAEHWNPEEDQESLPFGLDLEGIYEATLRHIVKQQPSVQELAKRTLMWVLYSARSFRAEELIAAITEPSAEPCQPEDILEACGDFLAIDYEGFIRFSDSSGLEYLKRVHLEINTQMLDFFPTPDNGQAELARSCLTYLLRVLDCAEPCKAISSLRSRLTAFPFARYASGYFDRHIHDLSQLPVDIQELLDRLLNSKSLSYHRYSKFATSRNSNPKICHRTSTRMISTALLGRLLTPLLRLWSIPHFSTIL